MQTVGFDLVLFVFVLQVLRQTFPQHTFLMNGLIHGVKVRDNSTHKQKNKAQFSVSHDRNVSVISSLFIYSISISSNIYLCY